MAKGKFRRLAVIGAAIGGFVFFWRKRKGQADSGSPTPDLGSAAGSGGMGSPEGGSSGTNPNPDF